jgi:hypothetical protein
LQDPPKFTQIGKYTIWQPWPVVPITIKYHHYSGPLTGSEQAVFRWMSWPQLESEPDYYFISLCDTPLLALASINPSLRLRFHFFGLNFQNDLCNYNFYR